MDTPIVPGSIARGLLMADLPIVLMRKKIYWISLILALLVPNWVQAQSSTVTGAASSSAFSSTNSPIASAPVGIALPNVLAEADTTTTKLQDIDNSLSSDQTLATVAETLPQITHEIDEQQANNAKLLNGGFSLATLRSERATWETLAGNLNVPQRALVSRITLLDGQVKQLAEWTQTWQATLALAKSSAAPPDILQRINSVLTVIGQTTEAVQDRRTQTLFAQGRVAEQGTRIQDALAVIEKEQESAVSLLFTRDSVPLWNLNIRTPNKDESTGQDSFAAQIQDMLNYARDKSSALLIHFICFILLAVTLIRVRREFDIWVKNDPALQHAAGVFAAPVATAALIALLVSSWLYPLGPRLFMAGIEATALIPAAIILRSLVGPSLLAVLYAMVFSYFFNQVRHVVSSSEIVSRGLFIFELLAGTLFLAWLIRSRHLSRDSKEDDPVKWIVEAYAHVAILFFIGAGLANVLGYVHLSSLLGNATLSSSYVAVILFAAARILDALTLSALKVPPLSRFGLVQHHHELLAQSLFRIFQWTAALFWLWETLDLFSLRALLWTQGAAFLTIKVGWGADVPSLGDIFAFGITVWASFFISKMIRFVLEEEIFPHLKLPAGVPYTASMLVHYGVLILGFFAALEFLGIRLGDYAVLAGALGVGLGFGLQTIMNNFFSGLILLFERPIKVGDIIQVDTAVGVVERIGIRASVIRLADGSEVIVPNANLISNQVTNWTFSNRRRMVSIPIAVVSKTDPKQVMALLVAIARDHPLVLKNPPPQALMTNFTAAAMTLELHVWTDKPAEWVQIRSDLSVAINAALAKENIAIG